MSSVDDSEYKSFQGGDRRWVVGWRCGSAEPRVGPNERRRKEAGRLGSMEGWRVMHSDHPMLLNVRLASVNIHTIYTDP
jgi:hypothetical protein